MKKIYIPNNLKLYYLSNITNKGVLYISTDYDQNNNNLIIFIPNLNKFTEYTIINKGYKNLILKTDKPNLIGELLYTILPNKAITIIDTGITYVNSNINMVKYMFIYDILI